MRRRAVVAAAAALSAVPAASPATALPPIPDWPLGVTCHMTQLRDATIGGYVFKVEGGPLLPVSDKGEPLSDVEVTCSMEVIPNEYPAFTLAGTSTNIGGVAYLAPIVERRATGTGYTTVQCSHVTWTDSTGAARTGGNNCVTVHHGA